MTRFVLATLITSLFTTMPACNTANATAGSALPDPVVDAKLATTKGEQIAVFAGGCFWGIEAVFEHVKGVISASSGYSGGAAETAHYELVSAGNTGHAESVQVKYDPSQISYGQLLKVYFAVAHDPTQLNRQGPDTGTQYRSAIFFNSAEQKSIADAYIAQLNKAGVFDDLAASRRRHSGLEPDDQLVVNEAQHPLDEIRGGTLTFSRRFRDLEMLTRGGRDQLAVARVLLACQPGDRESNRVRAGASRGV